MPEVVGYLADCGREVHLFDIHMEQITQQPYVSDSVLCEEAGGIGLPVEEIGLVAVERFIEKHLALTSSPLSQRDERCGEQFAGCRQGNLGAGTALHRTENRRCRETRRHVDDSFNESHRLRTHMFVGIAEREAMPHPARTSSHGGQGKAVCCQELAKLVFGKGLRIGGEDLDSVKAELGSASAGFGERGEIVGFSWLTAVEDKRAAPRFGHEADRDSRLHTLPPVG